MTQNPNNVAAASPKSAGGVYWAPKGTALPTDATTALDAAFVPLGILNEEGPQPAGDAAAAEDRVGWGGDVVLRLLTSKSVVRYDYTLIEVYNQKVAEFTFGEDNVTVVPATTANGTQIAISDNGTEPPDCVLVLDIAYKGKSMRIVLPEATSVVNAENALVHTAEMGYQIQTTALPDAAGNRRYIYLENDDLAAV
jgi:hypothetical protein